MSEWFTYGSVRGAAGNGGPYRDKSSALFHNRARLFSALSDFKNGVEPGSGKGGRHQCPESAAR